MLSFIALERKKRGLKQRDLARAIGLSSPVVSHIECRRWVPDAERRKAIALELGHDEEYFFEPSGMARLA